MSKKCPSCLEVFDDNYSFCSNCGTRLVDDSEGDVSLNLGNANAICGGININRSKNITSHDTHYHSTIVNERAKSETELKLEATNQLRSKAEEIIGERGRIDSVAMAQLRPFATQLGIDDETFKSIIKDVRSNRNGHSSGLSAANARYLLQAQQAVQTNDMDSLSNLTPRLEAMAAISLDDTVQYLYYLTLSLLYPLKSMEVFENQTDENYWRSFWAIISYIRTGKHEEAIKVLALFDPLRFEKSEEDQNLLEAYFNIMKDDKDGAQEFLDEILGEPTTQLKPLLRAIEITLYEEDADSLEVRFYKERVLSKSDVVIKSSKKVEKTNEADEAIETPVIKNNAQADALYAEACAAQGPKRVMLLQKAADAGSLDAMYDLGDCYLDGEGVNENKKLAIEWYTKAAELNHLKSQAALGALYMLGGEGLNQNYVLAEKFLTISAEKDFPKAQLFLSMLYLRMEEYAKALVWARKVADIEPDAYSILGEIYLYGLGVDKNEYEGLKYYEKAANNGDADAQNIVGNLYSANEFKWFNLDNAFKYYQMAANQDHIYGMYNLALSYYNGDGCAVDMQEAFKWMEKASDAGCTEAKEFMPNFEVPAEPNYEKIIEPKQKSNEPALCDVILNNPSQMKLQVLKVVKESTGLSLGEAKSLVDNTPKIIKSGISKKEAEYIKSLLEEAGASAEVCSDNGTNLPGMNSDEAIINYAYESICNGDATSAKENLHLLRRYANMDEPRAQFTLALCYHFGYGVKQNYQVAASWLNKSADFGPSSYQLGLKYEEGHGCGVDMAEAAKWYRKAANVGMPEAQYRLGLCYIRGEGVVGNDTKGLNLINKAAEQGFAEAIEWMKASKNSTQKPNSAKQKSPSGNQSNIEIQKVWVDTDGVGMFNIHCDWVANNLKGVDLEFRLYITAKSGKKLNRDSSANQWYYLEDKFCPSSDSHKFINDTCPSIPAYQLNIDHNEEKNLEFNIAIYKRGTDKRLYFSKNMTCTVWYYFNFFSKNKFEVRAQQCLP
jgi:ribosomal protein L7/L12